MPTFVQIMDCRLFGAKPLSKPIMDYCQFHPKEHISIKFQTFWFKKLHVKVSSAKNRAFCRGLNVLSCFLTHMTKQDLTLKKSHNKLINLKKESQREFQRIFWAKITPEFLLTVSSRYSRIFRKSSSRKCDNLFGRYQQEYVECCTRKCQYDHFKIT